jgi:predicted histidine transporter YuiF (NhaC family)
MDFGLVKFYVTVPGLLRLFYRSQLRNHLTTRVFRILKGTKVSQSILGVAVVAGFLTGFRVFNTKTRELNVTKVLTSGCICH